MNIQTSYPSASSAVFKRGSSARAARKEDVFDVIDANFDRFDRDQNGTISWKEMRMNVADASIKGKDAAALATLYCLVSDATDERGNLRKLALTPELLSDLKDEKEIAVDDGEDAAADLYYQKYLGKLENASSELFVGMPDGMKVAQGFGPSCAILATTVGQALLDPQVIKEAITQRPDGKVSVKFPGLSKPIVVAPTTDTETALFATAGKNGTWLNHLEKAWGTTQTSEPLAAFEQSSWPAKSIRAWSNASAVTTSVPKKLEGYRKGEVPDFLGGLVEALDNGRIAMTWTRNQERKIENLVPGHAHTVLGFNAKKGTITVRNPWGHREPEKNGKARDGKDDGVFELSLAEFVADFGRISVQTSDRNDG